MSQFRTWIIPEAEEPSTVVDGTSAARAEEPRTIALFDNTKGNADLLLDMIGRNLKERNEVIPIVYFRKEKSSSPAAMPLLDEIAKEVDLVIAAMAD